MALYSIAGLYANENDPLSQVCGARAPLSDKIVQIWVDFGVWCARTSSSVIPTNNYLPAIRCAMPEHNARPVRLGVAAIPPDGSDTALLYATHITVRAGIQSDDNLWRWWSPELARAASDSEIRG